MAIIEVSHVTKEFRLGVVHSIKQTLLDTMSRLRGIPVQERPLFKALDDVDFRVQEGEVLGIIGQNGAGKSTLLKLLANISKPTHGSIKVRGKVAPLIEVGAGLVPDLTGRENIYLNGSILGMKRAEIDKKFDEIVTFAELEEFIDTPIKRYSSGMMIKLGFSIATSIEAEILIVDEVLAVGDLAFQRKCFDRMEELIKGRGNTVLLVSHNIRQVERMCSRVIMLDHGKVIADGEPFEVSEIFYRQNNQRIEAYHSGAYGARSNVRSSGEVDLVSIEILDNHDHPIKSIPSGGILRVRARLKFNRPLKRPEIVIGTHTTDFFYLSASSTATLDNPPDFDAGIHDIEYIIPNYPLVAGTYCIRCVVFDHNRRDLWAGENLTTFNVLATKTEVKEPVMRRLNLITQWRLNGETYNSLSSNSPMKITKVD